MSLKQKSQTGKRTMAQAQDDHCEIHVIWDEGAHGYSIETDTGRTVGFHPSVGEALAIAVRRSQHDHAGGLDVSVCLHDKDGTVRVMH
jgi:hypothetical protein